MTEIQALGHINAAEEMIKTGDFANARKSLFKSMDFFPMDHVIPMLTVCDILLASSNHIPGLDDFDYHKILLLEPSSTLPDIALRFKKLQAMLQPLQDSFPGTKLALRFIMEAFLALSDSDRRCTFDSRRKAADSSECYRSNKRTNDSSSGPSSSASGQVDHLILSAEMDSIHVADDQSGDLGPSSSASRQVYLDFSSDYYKSNDLILSAEMESIHVADDPSPSTSCSRQVNQDFFNFEEWRNIGNINVGEIWATRDHHRYVQIISKPGSSPSSSSLTVLRLKPIPINNREMKWCLAGLPVGCCSFSLDLDSGKTLVSPKELSHRCTLNTALKKDEKLSIYPKKGEVWAMHNDFHFVNCESSNPERIASFGFRLAEVLVDICSDYIGIECAFLEKVDGFEAVFRRKMGGISGDVFRLSPRDFFLLSHQIPAIRLTGNEGHGIESGMWEVDNLSVPNSLVVLPFDIARDWIKTSQS